MWSDRAQGLSEAREEASEATVVMNCNVRVLDPLHITSFPNSFFASTPTTTAIDLDKWKQLPMDRKRSCGTLTAIR